MEPEMTALPRHHGEPPPPRAEPSRPHAEPSRPRADDLCEDRPHPDDAALIEWSWKEPETFAELYDRHAAPLYRYVSRRLGDAMAEDVVADTFLAAFRRRQGYDLRRTEAIGPKSLKIKNYPLTFSGTMAIAWADLALLRPPRAR